MNNQFGGKLMNMEKFVQLDPSKHKQQFIDLNIEHLGWIVSEMLKQYQLDIVSITGFTVEEYVQMNYLNFINSYKDQGILYIIEIDDKVIGMGGIRKIDDDVCEIKRMYIKPEFRGLGFGKELFQKLIEKAITFGYTIIRLETQIFMNTAHHIYRSYGFRERDRYPGFEGLEQMLPYTIFMEKEL